MNYDRSYLYGTDYGATANSGEDDMIDEDGLVHNDGRSNTETYFLADDVEYASKSRRVQFHRLAKINDGMYNRNDSDVRAARNAEYVDIYCGAVELNEYQRDCVKNAVVTMDLRTFGGVQTEHIILAIMCVVAERDMRQLDEEPEFQDLMIANDLDMNELKRLRKMARYKAADYI